MSNGLIMLISGVILFVITLLWIFIDINNKDKKEKEILNRAIKENSKGFEESINNTEALSKNLYSKEDDTEILEDSTSLLYPETELINEETELL